MKKFLLTAILLLLISHSFQQYMFKNPIGIKEKSISYTPVLMRNDFQLRLKQTDDLRTKEMAIVEILNKKMQAERLKVILEYLQPRAGKTSLLKDFYAHRY
jgi:hypothetical protein